MDAGLDPLSEQAIVFFDGKCNLCDGFVGLCVRAQALAAEGGRDRAGNARAGGDRGGRDGTRRVPLLRYAPLQGETARRLLPASARGLDSVVVRTAGGEVLAESDAVIHVLARLPPLWLRILAALSRVVPRPLRDAAYRLVARNRYRAFGTRPTCRVPLPCERDAFLP